MVLTESFYCNKAVKQTIFLILLSFYCHKTKQEPRNSVNSAFVGSCVLFKLNRSRWFTRQIIEYSIHPTHLIDNSAHNRLKYCKRNLGRLGCHEINRIDCTQCNCVVVSSLITHNTNGTHVGEGCKAATALSTSSR